MSSSHKTVTITTTAFNIDLIDPAIGMKLFTSHSNTPTTIKTINTCSNGINLTPFSSQADTPARPKLLRAISGLFPDLLPAAEWRGNLRYPV
jgi:hypothetical protein